MMPAAASAESEPSAPSRTAAAQLVNAAPFFAPMRKSLGSKRKLMTAGHVARVVELYTAFEEGEHVPREGGVVRGRLAPRGDPTP